MPTNITLSSVSGSSPFDIYVCDTGFTACIYVDTVNFGDIPYTFLIPQIYSTLSNIVVKVVDNNECIINQTLSV